MIPPGISVTCGVSCGSVDPTFLIRGGIRIPHAIAIKNLRAGKPIGKKPATQGKGTRNVFRLSIPTCHARGGPFVFAFVALVSHLHSRRGVLFVRGSEPYSWMLVPRILPMRAAFGYNARCAYLALIGLDKIARMGLIPLVLDVLKPRKRFHSFHSCSYSLGSG